MKYKKREPSIWVHVNIGLIEIFYDVCFVHDTLPPEDSLRVFICSVSTKPTALMINGDNKNDK